MTVRLPQISAALLIIGLVACSTPSGQAPLPDWLQQRIATYEAGPKHESPVAIWRITHQGQPAYFVSSPCCDQFDPLWDAKGDTICHPSGGFAGRGDGKCPVPRDAGTQATLVWSLPDVPVPEQAPLR